MEWIPFALAKLMMMRVMGGRVDVIISTASPFSCHFIGMFARWLFAAPWILDFGDPWSLEENALKGALYKRLAARVEPIMFQRALAVFWTTEATRSAYATRYPRYAAKMRLARMGFSADEFIWMGGRKLERAEGRGAIHIGYAGRLDGEHREIGTATAFFRNLANKSRQKVVLSLIGPDFKQLTYELSDVQNLSVYDLGEKDHQTFIAFLMEQDFLVLFGNSSYLQVPGKVYQYIGSGCPIIYLPHAVSNSNEVDELLETSCVPFFKVTRSDDAASEFVDFAESIMANPRRASNKEGRDQFEWRRALQPVMNEIRGALKCDS